jgi:hypothetical protein
MGHWLGGRISRSEAFEAVPTRVRGESARRLRASARLSAHSVKPARPERPAAGGSRPSAFRHAESFAERDASAFVVTRRSVWLTACRVADAAPHAGKSTFAQALTLPARLRTNSSRHPLRGSNCPSCLDTTRTRWRKTRGGIAAADFRLRLALGMVAGVRDAVCHLRWVTRT